MKALVTATVVLAAFSAACCHLATAQAVINLAGSGTTSASAQSTLTHPLARFEAHDEPALHALLRVGLEAKLPLGIVADERLCTAKVNVVGSGATPAEVIGMILAAAGGQYETSEVPIEGIRPTAAPKSSLAFLRTVISVFRVGEGTLPEQTEPLWGAAVRPFGYALVIAVTLSEPKFPAVGLSQVTVEHSLDTIVAGGPRGAWVVFPIANSDPRVIAAVSYGGIDPHAIDRVTCPQIPVTKQ